MDFIANQDPQIREMLKVLGIDAIDALFSDIPKEIFLKGSAIDDGLSEFEGIARMREIGKNNTFHNYESYLGAGAYEHYVPAIVGFVCQKSEFLTAYTPYQAEASQGMLQIIFEFQSAVCALTGMDASNASMYDGSSACAEALLMTLRYNKKKSKILVAGSLHPHYRGVIDQYLDSQQVNLVTIPMNDDGLLNKEFLEKELDNETASVLIQYPNFFGNLDDVEAIAKKASHEGALTVVCGNPLAYGLYKTPAELGADIAVGDCQPLGLPLQFGGPFVGYLACKESLIRQMPGRIVGETTDTEGKRGFVLTLQAREQHIRREKATSNICTNQALAALASLVHILWYGKEGIKELALTNFQRAAYLRENLLTIPGVKAFCDAPYFNEFAIKLPVSAHQFLELLRDEGIEAGLCIEKFFSQCDNVILIAVTEIKNKEQLDTYCTLAKDAIESISKLQPTN